MIELRIFQNSLGVTLGRIGKSEIESVWGWGKKQEAWSEITNAPFCPKEEDFYGMQELDMGVMYEFDYFQLLTKAVANAEQAKEQKRPVLDIKLYSGPDAYIYGVHAGKLWCWLDISGLWHEPTFYDLSDLPMMKELSTQDDAPVYRPYTRSRLVAQIEKQLADLAESKDRTREKLRELLDRPIIWAKLSELSEASNALFVPLDRLSRGSLDSEARERLEQMLAHRKDALADKLEQFIHTLQEEGHR